MKLCDCNILVTGANGFIGKNLIIHLNEQLNINILKFERNDDIAELSDLVIKADAIFHLAGENRPDDEANFEKVNIGLTYELCNLIQDKFNLTGRHVPLIFTSSTQAELDNPYGRSKLAAEQIIKALAQNIKNPCTIFRLPGVFGKWCKPNYNSVVATFCFNLARNLPIEIIDPITPLHLVYIDDVIDGLISSLEVPPNQCTYSIIEPNYRITLDELAAQIRSFSECRTTLMIDSVGEGLNRALYSTYMSYIPNEKFLYDIPLHIDSRGAFAEMIKTKDSGQFSYFTAYPGITRGGHYHHSKTEKFLVIKGDALFRFRHLISNEIVEFYVSSSKPQVIDTIPGWLHDVTNVGNDEMIVMLWANENFNRQKPDTIIGDI